MFDVMVESVAVANTLKRKSGGRRNKLSELCIGRTKPGSQLLARKEPNAFAANSGTVIKGHPP
jgi:hypothetical protein